MEGVVSYSFGVNNESTLGDTAYFLFNTLLIVVFKVIVVWRRENWIWLTYDLQWLKLTVFGNGDESPVVETTFPEFAKVNANFFLNIVFRNNIAFLKFVPSEKMSIISHNWWWCS
jgi:hypothetical protein